MLQSENPEHYWSLIIEPGWSQAAIWKIDKKANGAVVISTSPPSRWEAEEDLAGAVDTSLTTAIQNLPDEEIEPSKTVLGVSPSWVFEGQIKREYLDLIRGICSKLSLEPSGFVVLPEAIAHFVKTQEGTPLNAIVIGMSKDILDVTVFRLGNLIGTTTITRSVSIVDDVVEGLVRFTSGEPFPSRFLIYDGKDGELEEARQLLIDTDWEAKEDGKIKFLHVPKVEIVEPDEKILAVSLAGGSEIEGLTSVILEKRPDLHFSTEDVEKEESGEEKIDPAVFTKPLLPNEKDNNDNLTEIGPGEMGFVIGEDIGMKKEIEKSNPVVSQEESPPKKLLTLGLFSKLSDFVGGFIHLFSVPKIRFGSGKKIFLGSFALIALLFSVGILYWWFGPKASVDIYVSPKKTEENVVIAIDQNSGTDINNKVLKGRLLKTNISDEKTRSTTGTKIVGEKAKGSVKIRNGTISPLKLLVGTIIVGGGDLKFLVDTTASISAAISPSDPGTSVVNVTAFSIGSEYNLAKDELFKIGNYPKNEVDGISAGDFSGGSSREITAVSGDDRKFLEEDLTAELLEKGKRELAVQLSDEEMFVADSVVGTPISKNFSHKVGDEATTLKLELGLDLEGYAVKKSDLYNLSKDVLKEKTPPGYVLKEDQLDIEFSSPEKKENQLLLETKFRANLVPSVNISEIVKSIRGKREKAAQDFLRSVPNFNRAEIRLKPKFPGMLRIIPLYIKNIEIQVLAER